MGNGAVTGNDLGLAGDSSRKEEEQDDDAGSHASCSSIGEKSHFEDDAMDQLHIADESTLDGEVGKRLNQMVPVPVSIHAPRLSLMFV